MEMPVDSHDIGGPAKVVTGPGRRENPGVTVAAFPAGPVPSGQGGGLVEDEQLGVLAWCPPRPAATRELHHAHHPGPVPDPAIVAFPPHQPVPQHSGTSRHRHPIPPHNALDHCARIAAPPAP